MKNANDVERLIEENGEPAELCLLEQEEQSKNKKCRAIIKPFSEIEERDTEWLWNNKIPAGELCLLSGLPGQGKTFLTCYLASVISQGWDWPDGTRCQQGAVLFFRGEDSIEKTMKPRLRANGANMDHVMLFDGLADDAILTLHHVDAIRDAIRQSEEKTKLKVRLIVIDPMADHVGDTKENSNCEVRSMLKGLKAIADETGASFLLIQHTGKADRENMQQRVLGSTGIVASCRASFCLFTDKDTGHRIFAPMKNNLAVEPTSVVFTIDKAVMGGQVQIIDWELRKNADDIAAEMREAAFQNRTGRKPKESSEAENWLREFLSGGRKPVGKENDPQPGTVRYESEKAGHGWRTIERAKKSLDVISKKEINVWFWSLSNLPNPTEQDRQNVNQENQDRQNSFSATDGTESQALVNGGETKEHRQNASIYGNSGGVEQSDSLELTELNNVLNSNNQETDEKNTNSVFCSEAVPLPRKPPKKKPAQQLLIMTPSSRKEEPKHEQASLFD